MFLTHLGVTGVGFIGTLLNFGSQCCISISPDILGEVLESSCFKLCFEGGVYFTDSNVLGFLLVKYRSILHLPLCLHAIVMVAQIIITTVASTVNAMIAHKGNSYG